MKNGEVISPDKARPVAGALPKGFIEVEIMSVEHENPNHPPEQSEHWEVEVEYPDGYVKSHQVAKTATMGVFLTMVRNQLKGRHGAIVGVLATDLPDGFPALAGMTLAFDGE